MIAFALAAVFGWLFLFACIWAACMSRRVHETEAAVRLLARQRDDAERQRRLHQASEDIGWTLAGILWSEREEAP